MSALARARAAIVHRWRRRGNRANNTIVSALPITGPDGHDAWAVEVWDYLGGFHHRARLTGVIVSGAGPQEDAWDAALANAGFERLAPWVDNSYDEFGAPCHLAHPTLLRHTADGFLILEHRRDDGTMSGSTIEYIPPPADWMPAAVRFIAEGRYTPVGPWQSPIGTDMILPVAAVGPER